LLVNEALSGLNPLLADFLWPPGLRSYWKSSYLKALSDDAIDVVVDFFARVPSPRTVIVLEHYGNNAWDRVPAPPQPSAIVPGRITWW